MSQALPQQSTQPIQPQVSQSDQVQETILPSQPLTESVTQLQTDQSSIVKPQATKKSVRFPVKEKKLEKRIQAFTEAFISNGGNLTKAAYTVGTFKTPQSAAVVGIRLYKAAVERGLLRQYLETQGYDLGKFMQVAIEKMEKSKKPDWWDRMMKLSGYEDFITKKSGPAPVSVNIFSQHEKNASKFIQGTEVIEEAEIEES